MAVQRSLRGFLALAAAVASCTAAWGAEIYRIDPVHTSVLFRIQHLGVSYAYGRFGDVSGTLTLDAEHPERSSVQVEIAADSIDTDNEKRDRHLKSADFFDVARHPRITFRSTGVRKVGERRYEVDGDLSLHGVTKGITLRMTFTGSGPDPWGGYRAGFEGTTDLRRSDFGVNAFDEGAPGTLGDEVQITISVEAVRH